jgi:pimeloyl-ACP methyl ester carboxylesterase
MSQDWWQQTFTNGRQTLTIADASGREVAIAYGEAGMGQPLFLLHGLGSWSYNWRFSVQPLSAYYRVICVDAKGYGFSQAPPPPETVGHQVVELARIIQTLSDGPAVVVAESLGALTALAVAQSHPELIDRLVVLNVPIFPQRLPNAGMQLLSYLPLDWVQWIDQWQLVRPVAPLVQQITRIMRREVVVDPTTITDAEIYWLTYPYINHVGPLTQFAADLQLAASEIERLHQQQPNWISTIQHKLPHVTCPTLILWAECDRWFPVQDGERLHAHLPNSQFHVIPNCGHNASGSNPSSVNAAILRFLSDHGSQSGSQDGCLNDSLDQSTDAASPG